MAQTKFAFGVQSAVFSSQLSEYTLGLIDAQAAYICRRLGSCVRDHGLRPDLLAVGRVSGGRQVSGHFGTRRAKASLRAAVNQSGRALGLRRGSRSNRRHKRAVASVGCWFVRRGATLSEAQHFAVDVARLEPWTSERNRNAQSCIAPIQLFSTLVFVTSSGRALEHAARAVPLEVYSQSNSAIPANQYKSTWLVTAALVAVASYLLRSRAQCNAQPVARTDHVGRRFGQ